MCYIQPIAERVGWLVGWLSYGVSTLVGCLTPNPVYVYIKYI